MWDDRPQLRKSKPRILPEFWCARFTPGSSGWETVAHLQVGKLSSFFCDDFLPKIRCRLATCKLRGDVKIYEE